MFKSDGTKGYKEIARLEQAPRCTEIFNKIEAISNANPMEPSSNYNIGLACLELGLR